MKQFVLRLNLDSNDQIKTPADVATALQRVVQAQRSETQQYMPVPLRASTPIVLNGEQVGDWEVTDA